MKGISPTPPFAERCGQDETVTKENPSREATSAEQRIGSAGQRHPLLLLPCSLWQLTTLLHASLRPGEDGEGEGTHRIVLAVEHVRRPRVICFHRLRTRPAVGEPETTELRENKDTASHMLHALYCLLFIHSR
jgi:hypothetical protein